MSVHDVLIKKEKKSEMAPDLQFKSTKLLLIGYVKN